MCDLFCLPGGYASEFGVSEIDGVPCKADDWIWPACACLPMGFAWSVFLAQDVALTQVLLIGRFDESDVLHDMSSDVTLDRPRVFVYIDNVGIIGKCKKEVSSLIHAVRSRLEERGLETHEFEDASFQQDVSGISFDGL